MYIQDDGQQTKSAKALKDCLILPLIYLVYQKWKLSRDIRAWLRANDGG